MRMMGNVAEEAWYKQDQRICDQGEIRTKGSVFL